MENKMLEKKRVGNIRSIVCSLSATHVVIAVVILSSLFWWIYMGIFLSCTNSNAQEKNPIIHAEYTTYSEYSSKTVKSIVYYETSPRRIMTIIFTDGSELNIIPNKYVLDVQKK